VCWQTLIVSIVLTFYYRTYVAKTLIQFMKKNSVKRENQVKKGNKPVLALSVCLMFLTVVLGLMISIQPRASAGTTYHPGSGLINSYPSAYATNGTVSNPAYAFDKNNATAANYNAGANPYPGYSYFNTSAFNASVYEDYLFSSVDFKMKYDFATVTKSYPSSYSSGTDQVDSRPTAYGTNGSVTNPTYAYDNDQLTAAVLDVTSATATNYEVKTFPTYPAYTVLGVNVKMNYSVDLHDGANYQISLYVLTKSISLSYWTPSNKTAGVVGWLDVPEPNDGVWGWTDISNARIRVEARKLNSTHGSGSFSEYEGWLSVIAPNGPVTNPAYACDRDLATAATVNIGSNWYPGLSFFTVATLNTTLLDSYVTPTIDVKMKYAVTLTNTEYQILLVVKTRTRMLQAWSSASKPAGIEHWVAIPEPNDGLWNATDIGNIQIRVETRKTASGGTGTFTEYESWVLPGGAEYKVILTVGSSSANLQGWTASDYSDIRVFSGLPEPYDDIWNWTDVRNARISVQTRKTVSWGAGTFLLYETWVSMQADTNLYLNSSQPLTGSGVVIDESLRPGTFPTSGGFSSQFNSYPANHATNGSVADPTYAYDKNNGTAAVYTKIAADPLTPTYFEVNSFNDTFTSYEVTKINIYMNYGVTLSSAQYSIDMYVGSEFYKNLQIYFGTNRPASLRQWLSQTAPGDGVWNSTDIQNIRIVVRLKKTAAGGTATFNCYESWVAIPKSRIRMSIGVANVEGLYNYQVGVSWSPSIFDVTAVLEGPFLKQGGGTSFLYSMDNTAGFAIASCSLTGVPPPPTGVSGSGILAMIELQVKSYGSTLLHLYKSGLVTKLTNPISHWLVDGYFNNKILGDVNGDKTVNFSDLPAMRNAYGTTYGDTSWNPNCDFDWNAKADVKDLYRQGRNYGRSTP